jgi:PPOX class probable F420-dependent enzyme
VNQKTTDDPVTPQAGRPHFPPGYGIPDHEDNLLPWGHAEERLEQAKIYWIGTTWPDGRPHVSPVWGVWLDNILYFDGSPDTRRHRNIAANPSIVVHLESGDVGKDIVIVEGTAHAVQKPERSLTTKIAAGYKAKYAVFDYEPAADSWDNGGLYEMRPRAVMAWTDLPQATRWRFDQ